ncbi:MAG: adenylate/guanylate cyclase domain-containing protein, partial [Verrucomicrobiota bacterium]
WEGYVKSLRKLAEYKDVVLPSPYDKKPDSQIPDQLRSRIGLVATMGLDGEITLLTPPLENVASGTPAKRGRWFRINYNEMGARAELEQFMRQQTQQTIYIPVNPDPEVPQRQNSKGKGKTWAKNGSKSGRGGENMPLIQEMVGTPVSDPASGEVLGLVLRGTSAESGAQKFIGRYQNTISSGETFKNAIYLDGQIYARNLDSKFSEELAEVVQNLVQDAAPDERFQHEGEIQDRLFAVYAAPLVKTPTPRPAYEVAAFPLTALRSDLSELRIRGTGIGAGVMLVGILFAFLLARNLVNPLNELVRGTQAIRAGALDHRVEVNSQDELGELADSFNEMTGELKQKDLYRDLLGKVSDQIVAQALVSGTLDLELGGELKDVSVLFCDIRGFTAQTEHMDPTEVIGMLNDHMTAMTQVVRTHYGVVDKFMGDEIMAVFGGLKSYGNDAANAAACALDMIQVRRELNESLETPIEIGVGLASGEAVAGCMGSTDRLNFTVVGARVNLASRLCSAADSMSVLIDRNTLDEIQAQATVTPVSELELKGFSVSMEAFELNHLEDSSPPKDQGVAEGTSAPHASPTDTVSSTG